MPESLMTFYSDFGSRLPSTLYQELKRIYSNKKRKNDSDKTYFISDPEIKDLRKIFHESMDGNSALWDEFCDSYFSPYIQSIWEDATKELKLEFIGSRKSEDNEFMQDTLEWSKTMLIIGQTAIGVSDAMIINLFNSSRLPLVITTDSDVKYCFDKMGFGSDKYILTP